MFLHIYESKHVKSVHKISYDATSSTVSFVTKAMPIYNIDGKCLIKRIEVVATVLFHMSSYY